MAKQALLRLVERFPVEENLSNNPVQLQRSIKNAQAYAHSFRLASFEYPHAFGSGYKSLSNDDVMRTFLNEQVITFGVGVGQILKGAVSVYMPQSATPSIEYLFSHTDSGLIDPGLSLAIKAVDCVLRNGEDTLKISATSLNKRMINAYKRFGFKEYGTTRGSGFKIIDLVMSGQDKIERLLDRLLISYNMSEHE